MNKNKVPWAPISGNHSGNNNVYFPQAQFGKVSSFPQATAQVVNGLLAGDQKNKDGKPNRNAEEFIANLKGLPFYNWNYSEHKRPAPAELRRCCFNCEIGWPVDSKTGRPSPLFNYEYELFQILKKHKHVWVKKATGLGITEFVLRYMVWLAVNNNKLKSCRYCIVTGPRIDLAITLIKRIKHLFPETISFDSKETVVEINNVTIEAFPSHHLDSMRGLTDVKFIFLDEADFFPAGEQQAARDVSERYIGKSDSAIVMVSTPNMPGGLFETIEQEDKSLYKRVFLPYQVGLGSIYTEQDIDKARESPSFPREYELQYTGLTGNCFSPEDIDSAIEMGKNVDYLHPTNIDLVMGIDPGYGSSKFGICISQIAHNRIEIVYAHEFPTSRPTRMLEVCTELCEQFSVNTIFIDGSNPGLVSDVKEKMGEDFRKESWERDLAKAKKIGANPRDYMRVIPIIFTREKGAEMLTHVQRMITGHYLAIPETFKELVVQLRMATATEGRLDKSQLSMDLLDSLRLGMCHYNIKSSKK